MKKAHTQKNTLLKNAQANAEGNFFKRVFFSPAQEEFFSTQILFYFFSPTHGFTANTTSCASNVNRFGQSVCGLQTVVLRGNSRAAANIKLSEILKKGALVVNQTVVLLMKCVQVQKMRTTLWQIIYLFVRIFCVNSCPSYSPFFKTSPSPSSL